MAAGYARSSGRVGVFVVTSGPGATNSVTPDPRLPGRLDARRAHHRAGAACRDGHRRVPGGARLQHHGGLRQARLPAHRRDQGRGHDPHGVRHRAQRPARARSSSTSRATCSSRNGIFRGGGLLAPARLQGAGRRAGARGASRAATPRRSSSCSPHPSGRCIYAGGGVINADAANELRAFAQRFGIPVVTTLMGIGAIDTTSELSLHMLGMHGMAYANYAVEDCDFLFAVGSRFDDRVAGKVKEFAPSAKIAHLDIDASEIGKVKHVDWAHVSDCEARPAAAPASRRRASRRTSARGARYVAGAEATARARLQPRDRGRSRPSSCWSS